MERGRAPRFEQFLRNNATASATHGVRHNLCKAGERESLFTHWFRSPAGHTMMAMATVVFTANLQRHVHCPPAEVSGATLREVLGAAFRINAQAQAYVLDEQGELRKHVVVFIDGVMAKDRRGLSDPVGLASEIYVMQALSGGCRSCRSDYWRARAKGCSFSISTAERPWPPGLISWVSPSPRCCPSVPTSGTWRWVMGTSAPISITPTMAARISANSPRRPIRPNRKAWKTSTRCVTSRFRGPCSRYGYSRTAVRAGHCRRACGISRAAPSGSAAVTTIPAFIPSAWIRATRRW